MIDNKNWTNKDILHELLWQMIDFSYRMSKETVKTIQSTGFDEDEQSIENFLFNIQWIPENTIITYSDGTCGPTEWPEIDLVNAETGEKLSDILEWDFSSIEGEYIVKMDP
ncbi:MAG: hypothetical protein JXA42_01360 [Anaerolineales bacterium]|nr:hypothetical protein [Anaerolineales bacterium]